MFATGAGFTLLDWLILAGYLALVIAIGVFATKRRSTSDDFFLAGRSMPMWAVAVSVLATAQSAATFIGGPQQAYAGDLTYLSANLGPVIAAIVVGFFFLPRFYRHNVTSIYELIGHEMGSIAQKIASAMFMLGRVFASGARLYIVALPFSLVAFGDIEPQHLVLSILIVTLVATAYSIAGGIRAVIWTDVMQVAVYLGCMAIALVLIWQKIPIGAQESIDMLSEAAGGDKMRIIDLSFDLSATYTLWTALIGLVLFNIAAYGMDQDLTQRMLTCRNPRNATWSVIMASLITWPVLVIFLGMGLLLWVYHNLPTEAFPEGTGPEAEGDTRRVFLSFILDEMHPGIRGLMMAGLFAAAMSSMDSGLNAMSSTTIADFYRPWRARNVESVVGERSEQAREQRAARIASLCWAVILAGFACFCILWERATDDTLINFALGVMTFAYAGLLGVFFTAIFTKRGSAWSAAAAMAVGFLIVLALEPLVYMQWTALIGHESESAIAFPWRLTVAASVSFIVCVSGTRRPPALSR